MNESRPQQWVALSAQGGPKRGLGGSFVEDRIGNLPALTRLTLPAHLKICVCCVAENRKKRYLPFCKCLKRCTILKRSGRATRLIKIQNSRFHSLVKNCLQTRIGMENFNSSHHFGPFSVKVDHILYLFSFQNKLSVNLKESGA